MQVLYYPYLMLDTPQVNKIASCFSELYLFSPLSIRPRFVVSQVRFYDPLPKDWQNKFRALLSQYQIFQQIYTDKSFLEYIKHAPPPSPDEEKVTLLIRMLRGGRVEKEDERLPPEVISALFLHLAQEYSSAIRTLYQSLQKVKEQEESLKEILDTPSEIKVPPLPEFNLDYVHPDEDLRQFVDKILFAFSLLLKKAEMSFPICITDDEVIHHYMKELLKEVPFEVYTLYFPYPCPELVNFWQVLIEIYCDGKDYTAVSDLITPYLEKKEGEIIEIEMVFVPGRPASSILLNDFHSKDHNGIFCLWKGEGDAVTHRGRF